MADAKKEGAGASPSPPSPEKITTGYAANSMEPEEARAIALAVSGLQKQMENLSKAINKQRGPTYEGPHIAKRTFGYGGRQLDRGQIFTLVGAPHDRTLVDLGYCIEYPEGDRFPCRECGDEFMNDGTRQAHGKLRHGRRPFVPPPAPTRDPEESADMYQNRLDEWARAVGAMAEKVDDEVAQTHIDDQVAPLDLTKTTASREG